MSLLAAHSNLLCNALDRRYCFLVVVYMVAGLFKKNSFRYALALVVAVLVVGCGPKPSAVKATRVAKVGLASYYGHKFHGRPTASGERFNMNAMTAAHPHLAFGTRVRVTNLKNKRTVQVRINDRGPFVKGRIIDLSYAAAKKIGMLLDGVVKVRMTIVK